MNVFDDEVAPCLVLRNEAGEFSLWPAGTEVPGGWRTVQGPGSRQWCLAYIGRVWATAVTSGGASGVGAGGSSGGA
jgi:MbtH protein